MKISTSSKINFDCPLSEHPTPQFRRDSYLSLNGKWDFAITNKSISPNFYTKTIIVPFSVETPLSWINEKVTKDDVLHYRKIFSIPKGFIKKHVFLHFEAVDQRCDVFFNGQKVAHHEGGYDPFVIELTNIIEGKNTLQVDVIDDTDSPFYARGKQSTNPKGIWYTPTSGIWQSVWLESVQETYIKNFTIFNDFDNKMVSIKIDFSGKFEYGDIALLNNGKVVKTVDLDKDLYARINLFGMFHPWSPSSPFLYDIKININGDIVYSYFAVRKFSVGVRNGYKVFMLNDAPLFLAGVLDQGYYHEGGLTPSSDQEMIKDITFAKDMGFNFIRKHIKVEPMRWYYHCDRLGMLVLQDMVNFGVDYSRFTLLTSVFVRYKFDDSKKSVMKKCGSSLLQTRASFLEQSRKTILRLYNCPCIFGWTIFNEGWGQFGSKEIYSKLKILDDSRLFDVNSGWYDQGIGDFNSRHIYFKKVNIKNDNKRILFLSEFGGYSLKIPNHAPKASFGYKHFTNKNALSTGLRNLFEEQIKTAYQNNGLAGYVYTQLTDVETEINGLITYDRAVKKVDMELLKRLNNSFQF